ncbi:alpha/beta hydrolase family protein, partial [Oceanivirga salmonicida]|uniref:hypothetical protein n=1 Tax=Oceanivirga salmonicida TaxID=1769291 RepID=UPI0018CC0A74
KKVEKEENKGIEEKDISGFSILAGTNGANINVKKNDTEIGINVDYDRDGNVHGGGGSVYHKGNGLGLGFNKKGEITKSNLRVHGVNYNLHLDLAMPGGALKFADDLKNVINTPKAYARAIDVFKNVEKTDLGTQISDAMLDNNLKTETELKFLRKEIAKAKPEDKPKKAIEYFTRIGELGGKKYKGVIFASNRLNENNELVYASTTKDDILVIYVNNVDIYDLDNMETLVGYETKRWRYGDEGVDYNALHYKQDEYAKIKPGKTKGPINAIRIPKEMMKEFRHYTYAPAATKKEIAKEREMIEKGLYGKEYKNKYIGLNEKQKTIVAKNMIIERKLAKENEEKFKPQKSLKLFIDNPNQVKTTIDLKDYTGDQADKMGLTAYNDYNEDDTFGEFKNLKVFKVINDSRTGLRGYVLQDEKTKEFIIAFRGTQFNDIDKKERDKDLKSDGQLTHRNNDQYLAAYEKVMGLISENSEMQGKVILLVGHSLGGGIANYLALRIENTQSFVSDPTPVVEDEILKREIAMRIEKERKFAKELNIDPRDASGQSDSLAVVPADGLANRTTKNGNGEIVTKTNYYIAKFLISYFREKHNFNILENSFNKVAKKLGKKEPTVLSVHSALKSNEKKYGLDIKKVDNTKYMEVLAFQNNTNLRIEKDKKMYKLLEKAEVVELIKLLDNDDIYLPSEEIRKNELLKNEYVQEYMKLRYRSFIDKFIEQHQNVIVDSTVDNFTNQKKKYKIENRNIKKGVKR